MNLLHMQIKDIEVSKILFLVIIAISSCNKIGLSKKDYLSWINNPDNGLIKREVISDAIYTLALRPNDYLKIYSDSMDQMNQDVKGNISFVLKMSPNDGRTQFLNIGNISDQEYYRRINYYLNEFQNDIKLINGSDTFSPLNIIYERYYNISPSQSLVFGFESIDIEKEIKLIINDRAINTGDINFIYKEGILDEIPKLTL